MKAVYALYGDGHDAQRAVNRPARRRRRRPATSRSSAARRWRTSSSATSDRQEPSVVRRLRRRAGRLAVQHLARRSFTERDWPINVGNMPTVAWWPNLIVMFELTMLGAILATVVTLIITAGLGRRRPALYDPEVTQRQDSRRHREPPGTVGGRSPESSVHSTRHHAKNHLTEALKPGFKPWRG